MHERAVSQHISLLKSKNIRQIATNWYNDQEKENHNIYWRFDEYWEAKPEHNHHTAF